MKKIINSALGIVVGMVNILVGSCGGIVAVESLKYEGIDEAKAHATAVAVILPLTAVSAIAYVLKGDVNFSDSLIYLLPGLVGSAIGAKLLPKIPKKLLGKIFSVFIIYAGVRMFLK